MADDVSPERAWWLRVPGVLVGPSEVFAAVRSDDAADLEARQEPILAVTILAGVAGVLLSPAWRTMLDQSGVDGAVLAVVTFIAGLVYGFFGYMLLGALVWAFARGLGSLRDYRFARHVVAFAAVPLAISWLVFTPLALAAFGGDWFRAGGSDGGAGGALVLSVGLAFAAWSVALLLVGVRVAYGFSWLRSAGALALVALVVAAIYATPTAL